MNYLHWNEQTITDFSDKAVSNAYDAGYVFTRLGKGKMQQTRSIRINLSKFKLSSENRRILKKVQDLHMAAIVLPYSSYDWSIGKLAKDFYENKFGPGIMSVQKIKEMVTDSSKSNFNTILRYTESSLVSFSICYTNKDILHYSYPFYDLNAPKDTGLGMMILAIQYAQEQGLKYVYLGSLQRPTDTYKLQFSGIEWFDGTTWNTNIEEVKKILSDIV